MAELEDVIVVGSGPSGALAARTLVSRGLRVLMVDVGNDDPRSRGLVPDQSFAEIRASHEGQRSFFVGDHGEGIPRSDVKVGAQLTPPRQFITADTEALLPFESESFAPMQSLALGGLGAGWGAACFSFNDDELRRCGIYEPGFSTFYEAVISEIGVSADLQGDTAPHLLPNLGASSAQPPLDLDTNSTALFGTYQRRRSQLNASGLFLGKASLAVLTQPLGERAPNPYFDMDFWSDSRRSVYRPRYTVEALQREPRFQYRSGLLAVRFEEQPGGVALTCFETASRQWVTLRARQLMLCAGSLNSARIALHSQGLTQHQTSLLCNPYTYMPTVNLRMVGQPAAERRHSLAQLCGAFIPEDDPNELLLLQMYSYRSLLLFKLVKELPFPPAIGLLVARLLCNSLAIFGVHHSDAPEAGNWLRLGAPTADGLPSLQFQYAPSAEVLARRARREGALRKVLLRLGCVPYSAVHPGHAASIHYAGTIPVREGPAAFGARPDGRLLNADRVWVGDSSSWRHLPAKGLTLTIMANAVRVAKRVAGTLSSEGRE